MSIAIGVRMHDMIVHARGDRKIVIMNTVTVHKHVYAAPVRTGHRRDLFMISETCGIVYRR